MTENNEKKSPDDKENGSVHPDNPKRPAQTKLSALASQVKETETKSLDAPLKNKDDMGEFFKTALFAVVLALIIRSFLYEPFNIPSSSMKPTLLVGDYLFVSKPAYGYSRYSFPLSNYVPIEGRVNYTQPKRGDVIVFKLPSNPSIDYIKRIIGMPGDRVSVQDGRLFINGIVVPREKVSVETVIKDFGQTSEMIEYIETLPGGIQHRIFEETDRGELDNTQEYTVPPRHFFVMGDNRDNSQDSRVSSMVGPIPYENIVGRADILFFSIDDTANIGKPWTWPGAVRYGRLFQGIGPDRP